MTLVHPGLVIWVDRGGRHRAVVVDVKGLRVTLAHATSVNKGGQRVAIRPNTPLAKRMKLSKATYFYPGDICVTWVGNLPDNPGDVIGSAPPLVERLVELAKLVGEPPACVFDDDLDDPSPPADDDA